MTPIERTVQAEHQRQEEERMSEIHEGLSRAAHDVGVLVVFAVADGLLEVRHDETRAAFFAGTVPPEAMLVTFCALGAWRAAWWGGR